VNWKISIVHSFSPIATEQKLVLSDQWSTGSAVTAIAKYVESSADIATSGIIDRSYALTTGVNCGFKCAILGIKVSTNSAIKTFGQNPPA
jgi:hypothetical protein